jgi:hypothetical protein
VPPLCGGVSPEGCSERVDEDRHGNVELYVGNPPKPFAALLVIRPANTTGGYIIWSKKTFS